MTNIQIKSISGQIHDTGFGGIPYKIVVTVEIPVKDFNKMCPISGRSKSYFGSSKVHRDLGSLVLEVNNMLYSLNSNIPAYNPSIDSKGARRASKGVKTMEFVYFLRDHRQAEALGFKIGKMPSGEVYPKYGQYVDILNSKPMLKLVK